MYNDNKVKMVDIQIIDRFRNFNSIKEIVVSASVRNVIYIREDILVNLIYHGF